MGSTWRVVTVAKTGGNMEGELPPPMAGAKKSRRKWVPSNNVWEFEAVETVRGEGIEEKVS